MKGIFMHYIEEIVLIIALMSAIITFSIEFDAYKPKLVKEKAKSNWYYDNCKLKNGSDNLKF